MRADIYDRISQLQEMLKEQGFRTWSQAIEDAVTGGATGTEIFMAVRFHLDQMLAQESQMAGQTRQLVLSIQKDLVNVGR